MKTRLNKAQKIASKMGITKDTLLASVLSKGAVPPLDPLKSVNTLYSIAPKSVRSVVNNNPILSTAKTALNIKTDSSLANEMGYSLEPSKPQEENTNTPPKQGVTFRSNPSIISYRSEPEPEISPYQSRTLQTNPSLLQTNPPPFANNLFV